MGYYTRQQEAQFTKEAKKELYALFGNNCVKCGFTDVRALQIDHRKGGGVQELKRSGNRRWMYRKLLQLPRKELREKYQLLCANCNWIKRWKRGERQLPRES